MGPPPRKAGGRGGHPAGPKNTTRTPEDSAPHRHARQDALDLALACAELAPQVLAWAEIAAPGEREALVALARRLGRAAERGAA